MTQYDIVGIGAALVDTELRVTEDDIRQLGVEKGLMTLCDDQAQQQYIAYLRDHFNTASRACGGSAANSMIAAAHLGSSTYMTCQVAHDADGDWFLEELTQANMGWNHARQRIDGNTGTCLVLITPDAERTMCTHLGASQYIGPENVEPEALDHANYLYLEGYLATSPAGIQAAKLLREKAEETQAAVTLSLSDPGIATHFRAQLNDMIGERADIIFCNADEAIAWTESETLAQALEVLKTRAKRYAVTQGAQGAVSWDGSALTEIPAPNVTAVDTNGAGDLFAGCMLGALNRGLDFNEAAKLGCYGASQVVTQFGPRLDAAGYQHLSHTLKAAIDRQ